MLLAAVDLGSNSFRAEIRTVINGRIHPLHYWKETVRLAGGLDHDSNLTEETQIRALETLTRFREYIKDIPPECIRAVGTQAFREARNSRKFLERAQNRLGHPIEILSGDQEAYFAYWGAKAALPDSTHRRLIVDIGGGSTELALGLNDAILACDSIQVGCVNTTLRYFPDKQFTNDRYESALCELVQRFEPVAPRYRPPMTEERYGSAGTFRAVSDVCKSLFSDSQGVVQPKHLLALRHRLLTTPDPSALRWPNLTPDRMEVIAGGLVCLEALFQAFNLSAMSPMLSGLRAGLLLNLYHRLR